MRTRKPKKKGNAPAFQFYVGDFMTGTITMSLSEVGGYIRLLGHQWASGSVPGDDVSALARAMVCDRSEAETIWPKIRDKFRCKKDGLWRNSRLEKERQKQDTFRKLQSQKGKKGGRPKAAALPGLKPEQSPDKALLSSPSGVRTDPPVAPQGGRHRRSRRASKHLPSVTQSDIDAVNQQLVYAQRRDVLMAQGLTREQARDQIDREREAVPAAKPQLQKVGG